jgi:hypothetical protein
MWHVQAMRTSAGTFATGQLPWLRTTGAGRKIVLPLPGQHHDVRLVPAACPDNTSHAICQGGSGPGQEACGGGGIATVRGGGRPEMDLHWHTLRCPSARRDSTCRPCAWPSLGNAWPHRTCSCLPRPLTASLTVLRARRASCHLPLAWPRPLAGRPPSEIKMAIASNSSCRDPWVSSGSCSPSATSSHRAGRAVAGHPGNMYKGGPFTGGRAASQHATRWLAPTLSGRVGRVGGNP